MVESVQRHSGRALNSAEGGTVDYSLAGIDLKKVRHTLADVIQNNKDRWKELSVQGAWVRCYSYVIHRDSMLRLNTRAVCLIKCSFILQIQVYFAKCQKILCLPS